PRGRRLRGTRRYRAAGRQPKARRRQGARGRLRCDLEGGRAGEAEVQRDLPVTRVVARQNTEARAMNDVAKSPSPHRLAGAEHWTSKEGNVKLFLWNKCEANPAHAKGIILFVHGSSMASQPTFDLDVPGRPDSSVMGHFAFHGYDTWCVDMEGYGRSEKGRDNNALISFGADDCFAAATYIQKLRGKRPLLVYRISSGALPPP